MKTNSKTGRQAILKSVIFLFALMILVPALISCAARNKTKSVQSLVAPPPPPPPPPASAQPPMPATPPPSPQAQPVNPAGSGVEDNEVPFVVVEEMPMYPGGDEELLKFLAANVIYPKNSKDQKIEGRVIVRFCVTTKGSVDRVSILRGVSPELDTESIRVVQLLNGFKPGKQGGKDVPVWYMVPITFSLK